MSGYGYGPPPPPPPTGNTGGGHPYSGGSSGHGRGGGRGRGGGGGHNYSGGRGNYQGSHSQPRYDYAGQPYQQQNSAYAGAYPPANGYGHHQQAQWAPEHGRQAHTHAPVPISSTNYHPNYAAPQHYPQGQYPQQSAYGPAQPYGTAAYQSGHPTPPQAQPHWNGQAQPGRTHAGYHDATSSGSYHGSAPARPYDVSSQPPAAGYAQPYPQDPRVPHYPPAQPYPYSGPPAAPGARHHNAHGQQPRRGRGGHRDGVRGRGGHQGDRNRGNKPQRNENNNNQKTDTPSTGKKKKRKTNTLGLTPAMDSESEDDEGEESTLKELIGADAMKVSDIAAFIAERKKNFPTKAKMAAKKAAEEAQKKDEKTSRLEKQADELRKQLRKVESSIKRKREHGDEGDDLRDASEQGSDDDKPEVMSSRATASTSKAVPPNKRADISRHCKYYSTGGTCGKKGKCRFVHDPEVREAAIKEREANNGRLTIQQRLVLNDKEQEDLTVLQSIQYLRQKGIMKAATPPPPPPPASAEETHPKPEEPQEKKPTPPVKTSLLPAAPPSLPPVPPKREPGTEAKSAGEPDGAKGKHYDGWLLQPYGSKK